MTIEDLVDNFSFLDSWEDRYGYLISLGKGLPAMEALLKTDTAKVRGCISEVWMVLAWDDDARLRLIADSDTEIVRGLIVLLKALFEGKTAGEARAVDVEAFFARLGFDQHLQQNRRNGFYSMVERVRGFISR